MKKDQNGLGIIFMLVVITFLSVGAMAGFVVYRINTNHKKNLTTSNEFLKEGSAKPNDPLLNK